MKIAQRLNQLGKFGVRLNTFPLREDERKFNSSWVMRFEDGEGLEYITGESHDIFAGNYISNILCAELGSEKVRKIELGYQNWPLEGHVILDLNQNIKYTFFLPSRSLLNEID